MSAALEQHVEREYYRRGEGPVGSLHRGGGGAHHLVVEFDADLGQHRAEDGVLLLRVLFIARGVNGVSSHLEP